MTLPANMVPIFKVVELPTCQVTAQGCAPLMRRTCAALPVVKVVPIWKTKMAFGLDWASRVRIPLRAAEVAKQYTPGKSVCPPRSWPERTVPQGRAAAWP